MRAFVLGAPALADAVRALGHDVLAPPAAPVAGLAQAERQWFVAAIDRMLEADVLVADVGHDAAGAGWAVAWFLAKGRLAVVLCPKAARATLSPLVAANPSPWCRFVVVERAEDAPAALAAALGARAR